MSTVTQPKRRGRPPRAAFTQTATDAAPAAGAGQLWLTPAQVAAAFLVTSKTVTNEWIPAGHFSQTLRLPNGEWRISFDAYIAFQRERTVAHLRG